MPLKANFILPSVLKAGGVLVVLEYARRLNRLGHDVAVYHPLLPYGNWYPGDSSRLAAAWKHRVKPLFGNLARFQRRLDWLAEPVRVSPVPFIHPAFIRDADAVVATAWPTAYSVAGFPASKGRKFYFIQHYETWDAVVAEVDASYRLPLELITIAPWLTDLMREKFGRQVAAEIHNGLDLEVFQPGPPRPERPPTLLMLHHTSEWKGSREGLEVLRKARARHPETRVRLFGLGAPPPGDDFEYFRNPSGPDLVELYQSADIFLSPSHTEGWGLPVMEAMACGCAVVATKVGCVPVVDERDNLLVAEPGDFAAMERHLDRLLGDPGERRRLGERGALSARKFGWDGPVRRMEAALSGGGA